MEKFKIIIDAMGGDNAPKEIIEGALLAFAERDDFDVIFTGKEEVLMPLLQDKGFEDRYEIVHTSQEIEMAESPVNVIKRKKDSSMVVGLNLLKEKKGDAFLTAGSTGACIAGGTLIVRRIKGVERAALCPFIPNVKGRSLLIDCGANVDCRPEQLRQFGQMGSIYMQTICGMENPRVALINNGAEEEKGCALTKEAYALLKETDINFIGNIEGRDIMLGGADVLVCDGFVGNVLMKFLEGTGKALITMLKKELMSSTRTKLGAALAKPAFQRFAKSMDYREYGGSLLLGVNGVVVKSHGSSDRKAIKNSIFQSIGYCESGVLEKISEELSKIKKSEEKNEADNSGQ